jgi:hypothetical protein
MSTHLTPVEVCERLIGPIEDVARIAGSHPKRGYSWRQRSKWADAGDFRSMRHVRALHAHACARGIPLTLDHLVWGASEDEVARLAAGLPARPCAAE